MKLTILLLALAGPALTQDVAKLWSVDLSSDHDFLKRLGSSETSLRPPTLGFLNEDQIIVAFDDSAMSLPSPKLTPYGFHVLEVRADSGSLGRKLSFKVLVDTSQAAALGDGNFLVLAGESLKKFSSSFREIASLPAPLKLHGEPTEQQIGNGSYLNAHYETWNIHVATSGKEFALAHVKNPHEMEVTWLRASDLSLVGTARGRPVNQESLSSPGEEVWLFPYVWAKNLLSSGDALPLCNGCLRAYFLTDDLVFLDERDRYEIKTTSGTTRARGKLNSEAHPFCLAATATRFGYITGRFSGSGFPLKTHFAPHIDVKVFDWSVMKQVGKISFEKAGQSENSVSTGFKETAIALSPDGQRLLVLVGSRLSLYKLK